MAGDRDTTFSAREMEVLALAWQCMDQQPKIDMVRLARLTGYTPGSASVTFGNIKRKLKLHGEALAGNSPATPKRGGSSGRPKTATPKSTNKRGAAAAANGTPSKRSKKGGKQQPNESDQDDEEDFRVPDVRIKKEEPFDNDDDDDIKINHKLDFLNGVERFAKYE